MSLEDQLVTAARNGQLDVVKHLVEQGANLHAWDEYALRVFLVLNTSLRKRLEPS